MNKLDWENIRYFLAAARSGSLSAASRELNSHQPTVGRRIDALEQQLGLVLFQRHPRGLTLTEDGIRILEAAEEMSAGAATLDQARRGDPAGLQGSVRIAAPEGIAVYILTSALVGFCQKHADLNIDLQVSASTTDLSRGEADIAVRLHRPKTQSLIVRRLGEMKFGIYASSQYLAGCRKPASEDAVRTHRFVAYGEQLRQRPENVWLEEFMVNGRCILRSDNTPTRLEAIRAGLGIGLLPHLLAGKFPELESICPEDGSIPANTLWLVVHKDLRHVARVSVVMDFLAGLIEPYLGAN